jgi:hypothetical protein
MLSCSACSFSVIRDFNWLSMSLCAIVSKTLVFRLMSEFTPYELAPLVAKSGKQLGRYCAQGCFGHRARRTSGGHWRILATSKEAAAAYVRRNLPASIRKAGGGAARERQRSFAKLAKAFKKASGSTSAQLIRAAGLRAEGETLGEDVFAMLKECEDLPGGLESLALAGWIDGLNSQGKRITIPAAAKASKTSLSTFRRKFARHWPVAVLLTAQEATREARPYVLRDDTAEAVEFPAHATADEVRRWSSACRAA